MKLEDHLRYIIQAHRDHPIEPSRATRKWDSKTLYAFHPIWCALTLLSETTLPEDVRGEWFLTLLYHDIPEDTTVPLPEELPKRVKYLVKEMTFKGSSAEEMQKIWSKSSEIKLLKLYDKVSNLMDGIWMGQEKRRGYIEYTKKLTDEVEKEYGDLNIVKISRAITL